jgi:Alpha/beta hydrolase of unknown function (DUF900).
MQRIFLIIFLIVTTPAFAQTDFNSEQFWQKLIIMQQPPSIANEKDTCIVVASNRAVDSGKLRFMKEITGRHPQLHYFFIKAQGEKWYVYPMQNLQQAVSYMPQQNRDWLVYTEGMGKIFTTDVDRAMRVAGQYNVNVLLLDYPSIRTNRKRTRNYYFAIKHARHAYRDFAPVLDTVYQLRKAHFMGSNSINLFFHSMGNNLISKAVQQKKIKNINKETWVDNVILNAPCVKQKHHTRWLNQIDFAKKIYVHYNPNDYTLFGAQFMTVKKQLGQKVKNPICSKAIYINFNTLVDRGHSYFVQLPGREIIPAKAVAHYSKLFHGDAVSIHNTALYQPTKYEGIGYDILP